MMNAEDAEESPIASSTKFASLRPNMKSDFIHDLSSTRTLIKTMINSLMPLAQLKRVRCRDISQIN